MSDSDEADTEDYEHPYPLHLQSDSDEADTDEYEPPEPRYLESDEWMESEEFWENILETKTNTRKKMSEVIRTRIEQQALPYTTAMAAKDREREQRMIIVFTIVITLCAIVLGLQSAFNCTCNLNF